ncbi:DUF6461 domain-containing protein [Streptomyces sp. NBC_00259]|uniref:DUF6461 domain-containing protein n=1 Tax=Streptomyces sp. NBC_00259 TaxID=2903643 RepID=UPI002E28B873|nr:DUF6461 domain-containing protein [Streptomyces sp. NBC_00259]
MTVSPDGVQWLAESYPQGFSVVFVRDLQSAELLARLGCEAAGSPMTREDAEEHELDDEAGEVLRAGECDGWAFAIQSWAAHVLGEGVIGSVSAGTEMVALVSTATIPWFSYAANGEEVCSFDPGMPWIRHGSDPDRLLSAMRSAGLISDDGSAGTACGVTGMLVLAEQEFQVGLSREVDDKPLLVGVVP